MFLQTNCAQFRALGSLPISGFSSENTLGLEASCWVAFAIRKETAYKWGVIIYSVHHRCNGKQNKKMKLKKLDLSNQTVRFGTSAVFCCAS